MLRKDQHVIYVSCVTRQHTLKLYFERLKSFIKDHKDRPWLHNEEQYYPWVGILRFHHEDSILAENNKSSNIEIST